MGAMSGLRVAITGSASGIGAAIRRRLEEEGARVTGVDLRDAEVEADLATPEGRAAAVEAVRSHCGGVLDRLVVAAGVGGHLEDRALVASVNFFGAVALLDGLRDALAGRPAAAALAVCSNSARFLPVDEHPFVAACLAGDEPLARKLVADEAGFFAYIASKHALSRAVRHRAREWGAAGIRLNGIAPGATETPLLDATARDPVLGPGLEALEIPLGRRAVPEEIARVAGFLLGPDAGYVHGSIWYVDGGNDAAAFPDRF